MQSDSSRTGLSEPVVDVITLAKLVRQARRAQRITQAELAGLSGTGPRFMVDLERGKPTVELNKVLAVLLVLGLHLRLDSPNNPHVFAGR